MELTDELQALEGVDIFREAKIYENLVGNVSYLDYSNANILVSDEQKQKVGGLPRGSFLLAFHENEHGVDEALLLRVIQATAVPTNSERHNDKDDSSEDEGKFGQGGAGLKCRILGTFYKDADGKTQLGTDVENYFSAGSYSVYKPLGKVLEYMVNFRDSHDVSDRESDVRIGTVRFSSSQRFTPHAPAVVYVSPIDILGKRSALFGMTRTGRTNTVKKIIQATVQISDKAKMILKDAPEGTGAFDKSKLNPSVPVGQLIFDINGEYTNENSRDAVSAVSTVYKDRTVRYSILKKSGFKKLVNYPKDSASTGVKPVTQEIIDELRRGRIVIIDLSQGDTNMQQNLAEEICRALITDAMERFITNKPNNFVQVYLDEAHNILPKGEEKDPKNIYTRLVNEGEKLSLGLLYATQEVSSISPTIVKNTQNWFISHMNNEDEIHELRKYYDFADFADGLVNFSSGNDKDFVRVKTYSNAYAVPVQIDNFAAEK